MREIRQSGSVRGVRREPYPYRDHLQPLQSSACLKFAVLKGELSPDTLQLRHLPGASKALLE